MPDAIVRRRLKLINKDGLHARPSQLMVAAANRFRSDVTVRIGDETADGKSILELMMMASPPGTEVEITAVGEDAREAVDALSRLILDGFGEELA